MRLACCMGLVCAALTGEIYAQNPQSSLGISFGQWQPNRLKTEALGSVFSGTADSTPFYSISFSKHLFGDISIRVALGYWAHLFGRNTNPLTLHITPVEIGMEQNLIRDSKISPYVSYGGSALLVSTRDGDHLRSLSAFKTDKVGFEVYLIAGIQAMIKAPIGLDLNFGYVVANLPESLGVGIDYSGARVTFGLNYRY